MPYAATTDVSVDRSRAAIEALLARHGASAFAYGWDPTHDRIQFHIDGRTVRFLLPKVDQAKFTHTAGGRPRAQNSILLAVRQADRQRWRALFLVIKAKLEAIESGIAVFEQEFLAFLVLGDDMTVGDRIVPLLADPTLSRRLAAGGGK